MDIEARFVACREQFVALVDRVNPFSMDPSETSHEGCSGSGLQFCIVEDELAGVEDLCYFMQSFGLDPVQESGSLQLTLRDMIGLPNKPFTQS